MVRGSLGGQRSGAGCSDCNGQDLKTKGNGQDHRSCPVGPKGPNETYYMPVVVILGVACTTTTITQVDEPGVSGAIWIQGTQPVT